MKLNNCYRWDLKGGIFGRDFIQSAYNFGIFIPPVNMQILLTSVHTNLMHVVVSCLNIKTTCVFLCLHTQYAQS